MAFSPISTTNPTTIFAPSTNFVAGTPNARWNPAIFPKKTNTFWVTSVTGTGDNPVYSLPYTFKITPGKIEFGCNPTKTVNGTQNVLQQHTQAMSFGCVETITNQQVTRQDVFGVDWEFSAGANKIKTSFVSGQAFAVANYSGLTPKIGTINAILKVNNITNFPSSITGNKFVVEFNNNQTWVLYTSSNITLLSTNGSLTATAPYTGVIKAAFLGLSSDTAGIASRANIYDQYGNSTTYVTGGSFDSSTNAGNSGTLVVNWTKNGTSPLLHFAAIHQRDANLSTATATSLTINTIRGDMIGYVGDNWQMTFDTTTKDNNYLTLDPTKVSDIDLALIADQYYRPRSGIDTYFGAKDLARLADYVQLAKFRNLTPQYNRFLGVLKNKTFAWLNGNNSEVGINNQGSGYTGNSTGYSIGSNNYGVFVGAVCSSTGSTGHTVTIDYNCNLTTGGNIVEVFLTSLNNADSNETFTVPNGTGAIIKVEKNLMKYDIDYGGLNSTESMAYLGAMFGAGEYNDHLFHYGYTINAFATIAECDPASFTPALQDKADLWLRDTLNPSSADTYFPVMRSHDLYWGHQWASGLSTAGDGNNQESSSENANGLYWAFRYFKATGRTQMADLSRLFLAQSYKSYERYWQMPNTDVYPLPYKNSLLVGILWLGSALNQTFFGAYEEYVKGIQMIPAYPDFNKMYSNIPYVTALWNKINTDVINRTVPTFLNINDSGFEYTGANGGYTAGFDNFVIANNVTTTAVTGTGTGLVINMNINQTQGGKVWEIFDNSNGLATGYQDGDIAKLNISGGLGGGGTNLCRIRVGTKPAPAWQNLLRNVLAIINPNQAYADTLAASVNDFDGGTSKALQLARIAQFTNTTTPVFSSINPSANIVPGTIVTVTGANFTNTTQLNVNGVNVTTTYISPTQLSFVAGAIGSYNVNSIPFTVTNAAPTGTQTSSIGWWF